MDKRSFKIYAAFALIMLAMAVFHFAGAESVILITGENRNGKFLYKIKFNAFGSLSSERLHACALPSSQASRISEFQIPNNADLYKF